MKNNLRISITIGTIIVFMGIGFLSTNFINQKRDMIYSNINLSLSNDNILNEEVVDSSNNNIDVNSDSDTVDVSDNKNNYEYYIGKIEIPKINLSRGFYDKNSSLNDVRWNVKVLKESSYPNVDKGNLILAAHSGNYSNSYFSNLYKLEMEDVVYIYYQNMKYTYKIVNIYNEKKDGDVEIKRNPNKRTLTLITCTKDDEYHQTIYILELTEENTV